MVWCIEAAWRMGSGKGNEGEVAQALELFLRRSMWRTNVERKVGEKR